MSTPAFTTYEGNRWAFMVADSVSGTPFGFGNTEAEAVADAGRGMSYHWTETDEWVVATPEWVAACLADGTLEVLGADELDEDRQVL